MRIQRQRAEAQQQLAYCAEDHQGFVDNSGAYKEKMLAKYDEDWEANGSYGSQYPISRQSR